MRFFLGLWSSACSCMGRSDGKRQRAEQIFPENLANSLYVYRFASSWVFLGLLNDKKHCCWYGLLSLVVDHSRMLEDFVRQS
jgi:hypothetical protein